VMDIYCMCKRNGKSVNHLLLHCDVASAIGSVFFPVVLGCPWLCLNVLLTCMTTSGPLAGQGVLRCVKWCIRASLRTERGLWGKLYLCSLKLYIFGQRRLYLLCRLVLATFLFVLLFLVRWFLLNTSCALKDALHFQ
jgi:hypothetical protein